MSFLPAVFTDKCWLGDANDSWRQEVVAKDEEAKTTLHARLGLGEYHCHCLSSNTLTHRPLFPTKEQFTAAQKEPISPSVVF
jgi:hypothetical protein